MYLIVETNPNCEPEERMFPTTGPQREVKQVLLDRPGQNAVWCDLASVDENEIYGAAHAVQMDDSGAGLVWLILGGSWGVRLRLASDPKPWSLKESSQWGIPFLVLDFSASGIRFAP